jgi:UDP-N-acetylglucosamine 4,6-dehydratase/5-epimerase
MSTLSKDKTLLITGGTGSFGNAVLQRFLHSDFGEIRVFSRDEKKQEDMRISLKSDKLKFYIGDVRQYDSVHDALKGVNYVFHAAALKHVPSCEFYPMEAVRTNAMGAENAMRASMDHGVTRCVVLSTDKAVYPINAMGLSKAMMEKVMIAKSRLCDPGKTVLCGTRYGNVMAARGSVIPLFLSQLREGKPLTVTDPAMVSREEMSRGKDLGGHYRIPADSRDLNYEKYFVQGEPGISEIDDYTSHTQWLNLEQVKKVLMSLPIVREAAAHA